MHTTLYDFLWQVVCLGAITVLGEDRFQLELYKACDTCLKFDNSSWGVLSQQYNTNESKLSQHLPEQRGP